MDVIGQVGDAVLVDIDGTNLRVVYPDRVSEPLNGHQYLKRLGGYLTDADPERAAEAIERLGAS